MPQRHWTESFPSEDVVFEDEPTDAAESAAVPDAEKPSRTRGRGSDSLLCPVCGELGLSRCSNCGSINYCGHPHQKEHYRAHKSVCKRIRKLKDKGRQWRMLEVLAEGDETKIPRVGSRVSVHYTLNTTNGKVFDNTEVFGNPIELRLGQGAFIPGAEEAILTMSEGERSRFVFLPHAAYKSSREWEDNAPIPSELPFIAEIHLVSVA